MLACLLLLLLLPLLERVASPQTLQRVIKLCWFHQLGGRRFIGTWSAQAKGAKRCERKIGKKQNAVQWLGSAKILVVDSHNMKMVHTKFEQINL